MHQDFQMSWWVLKTAVRHTGSFLMQLSGPLFYCKTCSRNPVPMVLRGSEKQQLFPRGTNLEGTTRL